MFAFQKYVKIKEENTIWSSNISHKTFEVKIKKVIENRNIRNDVEDWEKLKQRKCEVKIMAC